mmetsp:Transcript_23978/g.59425  ORF Transcript_23978/g.59425 Transcript_23978/m.59425 type:complete len:229 (+) Transcript_23978:3964-4650(+)
MAIRSSRAAHPSSSNTPATSLRFAKKEELAKYCAGAERFLSASSASLLAAPCSFSFSDSSMAAARFKFSCSISRCRKISMMAASTSPLVLASNSQARPSVMPQLSNCKTLKAGSSSSSSAAPPAGSPSASFSSAASVSSSSSKGSKGSSSGPGSRGSGPGGRGGCARGGAGFLELPMLELPPVLFRLFVCFSCGAFAPASARTFACESRAPATRCIVASTSRWVGWAK